MRSARVTEFRDLYGAFILICDKMSMFSYFLLSEKEKIKVKRLGARPGAFAVHKYVSKHSADGFARHSWADAPLNEAILK